MEKRIQCNYKLPPSLVEKIAEIAQKEKRSQTKTVELAIEEYIEKFDALNKKV